MSRLTALRTGTSRRLVLVAAATISLGALSACGSTGSTTLAAGSPGTDAPSVTATLARPAATELEDPVTVPVTDAPAASVPVATVPETTVPETTVPSTPSPPPPSGTVSPPLTVPATTGPVKLPVSADPITGVDANGDAVIVALDGTAVVLHDGTDPDDPLPDEGEIEVVAGVVATSLRQVTIVGLCCEPSPGALLINNGGPEIVRFGHEPVLSPDESRFVSIGFRTVSVSNLDLTGDAYVEIADENVWFLDVAWADDTHVVALLSTPGGPTIHRYEVGADALVLTNAVSAPDVTALAGSYDGLVYTTGSTASVAAYAADTLAPVPAAAIMLPSVPLSAGMHDGELRWVDQSRVLHVGEWIVPGEYIWVG